MDQKFLETALKAVQRAPTLVEVAGASPLAAIPEGFKIISLAEHLLNPETLDQRVTVLTADAFLAYWNRFKSDNSVVFADERAATYTAILDYHTPKGDPGRCDHRAVYAAPKSKEWDIWAALDRKRSGQAEFAQFIEENYVDVFEPSHAQMIEVAMNIQVKKGLNFNQSTRLSDGQVQLTYNEEITGSAETKAGSIKVPDSFILHIPVFLGGPIYPIKAFLRYRIEGGRLAIGYDLHRPNKAIEAATSAITEVIVKGLAGAPLFLGAPA